MVNGDFTNISPTINEPIWTNGLIRIKEATILLRFLSEALVLDTRPGKRKQNYGKQAF